MKELSIEEKAKAYDKALEIARKINSGEGVAAPSGWTTCEVIFPELKESKDEKIRKALIDGFTVMKESKNCGKTFSNHNIHVVDILAWLEEQGQHKKFRDSIQVGDKVTRNEDGVLVNLSQLNRVAKKQGEQKPADTNNRFIRMRETKPKDISEFLDRFTTVEQEFLWEHIAKIRELDKEEQKPEGKTALEASKEEKVDNANKVESKFKVGDWVVYDHKAYKVVTLPREGCINLGLKRNGKLEFAPSTYCRPWTIADAKDGDVLTYSDSRNNVYLCIYKEYKNERVYDYCTLDKESFWEHGNWNYLASFNYAPATKEQCDTLMKAMDDAGYTFDFEKKELKKIEQKSDYSEEDKQYFNFLEKLLVNLQVKSTENEIKGGTNSNSEYYYKVIHWLKSLKDRVQPQPNPEWSKEDEDAIGMAIIALEDMYDEDAPNTTYGGYNLPFNKAAERLKSLKDRVLPQPKNEWSEEDEEKFIDVIKLIEQDAPVQSMRDHYTNWLKSIKDRYTWKPSDEQIKALRLARAFVVDDFDEHPALSEILIELEEQLKKLREE